MFATEVIIFMGVTSKTKKTHNTNEMKTLICFFVATILSVGQMLAQTNPPDEKSIVNKKYDENGNLIQYDSTHVQSWSSDSTFTLPLDGTTPFGSGFPGMDQLFQNFFSDSSQFRYNFPENFLHSPFQDDEFFKQFGLTLPDSLFMGIKPHNSDSLLRHRFGINDQLPHGYDFRDWQDFQKEFQKLTYPKFKTPEQQKEWEKLLERHQKEKNDFLKKMEGGK